MTVRRSGQVAIVAVVLLTLACLFNVQSASAQGRRDREGLAALLTNGPKVHAAFRSVVAQPSHSTVRIRCNGKDAALGTIVGADGWILTKYSELKGPAVCILKDGRQLPGRLTGVHEAYDLAMLKIDATGLKPIQWANVKEAVVGNWVATPGIGAEPIAVGVVSVAARAVTARDMPPIASNSGFLGIAMEPSEKGIRVTGVVPNSAAAKAGIKINDAILGVGDREIKDPDALSSTIQRFKAGETITLKVLREDEELKIKATLEKRPTDDRGNFQNRLGSELSNHRGGFPSILQTDTVVRPADCGGPLVDLDGKAVGINIARAGRTETYAVPADAIPPLLADLKSGKLMPPEERDREAKVATAENKVNAARADLKKAEAELKQAITEARKAAAEKRVKAARTALEKAEAELKSIK